MALAQRPSRRKSGSTSRVTKDNVGSYKPWADRLKGGPLKIAFVKQGGKTFVKTTPDFGG